MPPSWRGPLPRVAYSALCGVGSALTRRLLARLQVSDVVEVAEQAEPRADFGGLSSPNPEQPLAMAKVLALAERENAGLVLCHDPDADRLAVAMRTRAGNLTEMLILLGSPLGRPTFETGRIPSERCIQAKTRVSQRTGHA